MDTLDANSKAYKMLRSSFSMLANCFMVAVPFYATLYWARRIRKRVSISPKPSNGMSRREREMQVRQCKRRPVKQPGLLMVGLDGGWIKCQEQKKGSEGKVAVIASEVVAIGKC